MAEKGISQHKRLAMGDKVNKYAEGGFVTPRQPGTERPGADERTFDKAPPRVGGGSRKPKVPEYADNVVGDDKKPQVTTRGGERFKGRPNATEDVEKRRGAK